MVQAVHWLLPTELANVPGAHSMQREAPGFAATRPAMHGAQVYSAVENITLRLRRTKFCCTPRPGTPSGGLTWVGHRQIKVVSTVPTVHTVDLHSHDARADDYNVVPVALISRRSRCL